jgi:hypothetical protein
VWRTLCKERFQKTEVKSPRCAGHNGVTTILHLNEGTRLLDFVQIIYLSQFGSLQDGVQQHVRKIGLCQWEAQGMDKLTGHGGHYVNKGAEDRGSANRVRWPGLNTVTVGQEGLVNSYHWFKSTRVPRTCKVNRVQRKGK